MGENQLKGLLIAEPWMGRILAGRKTWEMRSQATHQRGTIALIRKGSGQVVGTADVVGTLPPLETSDAYAAGEPYHAITPQEQAAAFNGGWRTPWVLANVRRLTQPVPYKHPNGAVIWVNLEDAVVAAIWDQLGRAQTSILSSRTQPTEGDGSFAAFSAGTNATRPKPAPASPVSAPRSVAAPLDGSQARMVTLTGGNIRNHHIYLPLDFFPDDAIGGSNQDNTAPRAIKVAFRPGEIIETDIDGTKRILRARGTVRDFLERAEMREGDDVLIERTAPYCYTFSKAAK